MRPCRLTFSWWGCYGLSPKHKLTELAHSSLFCSCVCFCLYGPFNCISFHKFSRQPFAFLLCPSSSASSSIPYLWGLLGHYWWFHNQFSPFFPVLHCTLGPAKLQACPFPDNVFPPLPLSALSSSPFHCALQDGFGQTWWTGDMTIPLQFVSLYNGQEVFMWSNCLKNLGTDFLVGNMVFEWDV